MARSIDVIFDAMKASLVTLGSAAGLVVTPDIWSQTDYKFLILSVVAQAQGILEQAFDSHKYDVDQIRIKSYGQTAPWIQDKMLNLFEYDAVAVPIVKLDTVNLYPYYVNPNPAFRIIKYCSVVASGLGLVTIKCAKQVNGLPAKLSAPELAAAQSFITTIVGPSINHEVVSYNSDKVFHQLDVYYNGLYSAVIEQQVTDAIKNYYKNIKYPGIINITNLEIAIKNLQSVGEDGDVVIYNMKAREDTQAFGSGIDLVVNNTEVLRQYPTYAGYAVLDSTAGKQLSDFRNGISGIKNLNLIAL